jgi:hypothetical protein
MNAEAVRSAQHLRHDNERIAEVVLRIEQPYAGKSGVFCPQTEVDDFRHGSAWWHAQIDTHGFPSSPQALLTAVAGWWVGDCLEQISAIADRRPLG